MAERATTIETLSSLQGDVKPTHVSSTSSVDNTLPPQTMMQQSNPNNISDNELVDDILKEINQNQNAEAPTATATTEHQTKEASTEDMNQTTLSMQMDPQVQHNIEPSTAHDLQGYHNTQVAASPPELSHGEKLLHEQHGLLTPIESNDMFSSFNIIQFAKTFLLTMMLFIIVTNSYTHTLLCKIPYLCTTTLVNGISNSQLNFAGTMVLASLSGFLVATAQAFL